MAGFGGAVKLTGESEYRAALKQITQNLKEVSSEMKVVTSLYGKNDTSAAALTAKQDVLNKKLTEQKNKLSTLKAEYKAMQTQYDANAKKHDSLVKTYNEESAKLKQLEETVGTTSDEYKQQEKVVAELEKELMKSSAAQSANEKSMSQMRIEMNNAEADINKTTKELDNLEDALNESSEAGDDLGDAMEDAGQSAESASGGFTVMKGILADLASNAIQMCVGAMKDFVTQSVEVGKNFDSAMSEVSAISGATGKDLQMLRDTAKEFGSTTMFSASEAADALKYMSLAGWDANTSAAALGGVLDLAAASGMELGAASDMVTDYLSAFGMEAEKSGYFADLLAYAQANANTSAEGLGEAYKNCAANLNAAGQDIETTTSLLAMMANQGLKGSESGTALAAMMRDLTAKMEDGKVQIGDTAVAVMDANGNYRDLTDILKDVEKATDGMGDAERAAALSTTFTSDSIKGLNLIMNAGVDEAAKFEEELRNCDGTAGEMAKTMQDNLGGDLTSLSSQFEGVQIALYEKFEPALRAGVEVLSELLNGVQFVIDHSSEFIAVLAAMGSGVAAYVAYTTALKVMQEGWMALEVVQKASAAAQAVLNAVMAANPIGILIAAITALVAAFTVLWNTNEGFRDTVLNTWDAIKTGVTNAVTATQEFLTGAFEAIKTGITTVWENIKTTTITIWEGMKAAVSGAVENVKNTINTVLNAIKTIVTTIWNAIQSATTTVWNAIQSVTTTVWNGIKAAIDTTLKIISTIFTTYINIYKTVITTGFNAIKTVVTTVWNAIKSLTTTVWNAIKTSITNVVNGVKSTVTSVFNTVKSKISNAFDAIKSKTVSAWNAIKNAIMNPINAARDAVQKAIDKMKSIISNANFNFPRIKLPHFSISGKFSINPPEIPHFSVDWYKTGGVFDRPTILSGLGEDGAEAIVPLERNTKWIQRVADELAGFMLPIGGLSDALNNISNPAAADYRFNTVVDAFKEALSQMTVELDDDQVGKFVVKTVENAIYT